VITREWRAGDRIDLVLPMQAQRIKSDERVAANRGLVALRHGPLIYNVERADQPDITQALGKGPLTAEWRPDLLAGVMAIKGTWADGSPMLAIPNYARNNRQAQDPQGRGRGGEAGGDSAINYAPGSTAGAGPGAGAAPAGPGGRRGRGSGPRAASSIVWMKDQ